MILGENVVFKKMVLAAVAALSLAAVNAEAATILQTKVTGTINNSNEATLPLDSVFTVIARYDSELVSATGQTVLTPLEGITLSLTAGALSFDQNDDIAFPSFPWLTFTDGVLSGFDFTALGGDQVVSLSGGQFIFASNANFAVGELDFANAITTPVGAGAVPEPEQWALLIVGFGAAGAALRRSRKTSVTACLTS
jgi:hypothetical protein